MASCNFPKSGIMSRLLPQKIRKNFVMNCYGKNMHATGMALGEKTRAPLKKKPLEVQTGNGWDRTLPCINLAVEELETHGWLVNQTRMWLSSDWTVRHGQDWRKGEDRFRASTSLMVQEQQPPWMAMDNRNRLLKAVWVQQMASRKRHPVYATDANIKRSAQFKNGPTSPH